MSTEGGTKSIIAALTANLGIAVSKFVAFLLTGSSSLLAESIHSVADSGNQGLLLLGRKRAKRKATPEHPFGYGRERYIYAFIVSIVLFTLGGLFALYEGYHKISHPEPIVSPLIAIGVLVVAIGLETYSLRTAVAESNVTRGEQTWIQFIRHSKAPDLPVVLLEDSGALLGLTFALIGVCLSALTGEGFWDGLGTSAIGILLVAIAIILAIETKSLLLGEAAGPEARQRISTALAGAAGVESIVHMRTLHLGPEELLVAARISMASDLSATDVAIAIDGAQESIRAAEPIARVIYLEPDIPLVGGSPEEQSSPATGGDKDEHAAAEAPSP